MKVCPKCYANHTKDGRFCSRACANSRTWSLEDRRRKSESAKGKPSQARGKSLGPLSEEARSNQLRALRDAANLRYQHGLMVSRKSLRRCIADDRGYLCAKCGIADWNGGPITLQVDHLDGDASNNVPANLQLLCPNCHSQSPTFAGRNKGFGRRTRGLPLH